MEEQVSGHHWSLKPRFYFSISVGSGALSALSFAPWHLFPLVVLGFAALAFLIANSKTHLSAFLAGWSFGLGNFIVGLSWISESFKYASDEVTGFAWPAVVLLCAFLAVFPGLAAYSAHLIGGSRASIILAFPATWGLSEIARGYLFTGFPWNLAGYAWGWSDETMQSASVFGTYGLGIVTAAIGSYPTLFLRRSSRVNTASVFAALIPTLATAVIWSAGALRLSVATDRPVSNINLRIVQGNIAQDIKWDSQSAQSILSSYVELSRAKALTTPTHIFWPETAVPYKFDNSPALIDILTGAFPQSTALVFGAVQSVAAEGSGQPGMLNSLVALNSSGIVVDQYSKRRLVPFGEYVPLRGMLPLEKMTNGSVDFTSGSGPRFLDIPGLPRSHAMICYEAIFPNIPVSAGERWILNATNDGWFGTSSGPYQHFLAARFRSVETGLPQVRVANTGISAIIDGNGRVQKSLGIGIRGIIDGYLPQALANPPLAQRFGLTTPFLMVAIIFMLATVHRRKFRSVKTTSKPVKMHHY